MLGAKLRVMALMDGDCVMDMSGFGVGICIGGIYNAPSVRIMQPDSIGQASI